jgi:hypothetical protein
VISRHQDHVCINTGNYAALRFKASQPTQFLKSENLHYFCNPSTTTKRSMAGYEQQQNGNVSGGTCCNECKYVGNPYLNGEGDRTMKKVVGFKMQERANDEG